VAGGWDGPGGCDGISDGEREAVPAFYDYDNDPDDDDDFAIPPHHHFYDPIHHHHSQYITHNHFKSDHTAFHHHDGEHGQYTVWHGAGTVSGRPERTSESGGSVTRQIFLTEDEWDDTDLINGRWSS
jgi:hypothetical protein